MTRAFLAYRGEVLAYLTRTLRDADLAADLTQEAFMRLADAGDGTRAVVSNHRAYLYRLAHNLAVDHLRRHRARTAPESDLDTVPDARPSPEQVLGGRQRLDVVRAALMELPERTRTIFVLARLDGLTYRQVAERLEISDSSVQKHLAKAVAHVMKRLRAADQDLPTRPPSSVHTKGGRR